MATKLLNNKWLMIASVVVIAGVIICVLNISTKQPVPPIPICKTCPCDTLKTKAYCAMRKKIIDMGAQKWDRAAYYRFDDDIKEYADSNAIAKSDAADLQNLLGTEYLSVLGDTIKNYCANAAGVSNIYELETELSKLSANPHLQTGELSGLIQSFKAAYGLPLLILDYTSKRKYSAEISQRDSANTHRYLTMNILKQNPHLNKNLEEGLKNLKVHYYVNQLFLEQVTRNEIKTCNCDSTYNTSQFYRDTCRQIQKH